MDHAVLLTSPDQARPIVAEYLALLYRKTEPFDELRVLLPDGQYAELFPAYVDDGGLLQVDFHEDEECFCLTESQNVDKFRSKRHFARNLADQVDYVLEILRIIPRTPEFVRKDSL